MTRVLIGKGLLSWKVGSLKIEDISRDSRYIPSYPTPWPCGNPDPLHLIPSKLPRLQCLHGRGRLATCLGFSSDHATGGPSRGNTLVLSGVGVGDKKVSCKKIRNICVLRLTNPQITYGSTWRRKYLSGLRTSSQGRSKIDSFPTLKQPSVVFNKQHPAKISFDGRQY